ncbi:MAG TPA: dihydrolipoamide acetyltransferase family protein [Gaiellaceae bacterium]|nr:dihydrolipoamide acetyltransferase family protein [Gaiellaceae bacterium]
MAELTMPKLSDSVADAVIVKWLKGPGDAFKRGDALLEVETDKATVVYEAEDDGTLESILVQEGESAAVGQAIASLAGGESANGGRPNATPVARRLAVDLGVSLHELTGTGPGGRITQEDVQQAAKDRPAPVARHDARTQELTPTQATIARRMSESAAQIPVFTVSADADVTQVVALRRGAREESSTAPSLNDFVVKAAAVLLKDMPRFNASFAENRIELFERVNIGVAVATDDALLVPVVADADQKTIAEIAAETRRLAAGARDRSLRPEDLREGTFTVSNLGMFGVRSFTAIVDPPQTAILAVGAVRRAPTEGEAGEVVFRDVMTLTLSCDHRAVYGADGAKVLSRLCELLERPLVLVL